MKTIVDVSLARGFTRWLERTACTWREAIRGGERSAPTYRTTRSAASPVLTPLWSVCRCPPSTPTPFHPAHLRCRSGNRSIGTVYSHTGEHSDDDHSRVRPTEPSSALYRLRSTCWSEFQITLAAVFLLELLVSSYRRFFRDPRYIPWRYNIWTLFCAIFTSNWTHFKWN